MILKIKKIHSDAVLPQQMTSGAAGYDLTAVTFNQKGDQITYDTGIAVEIPEGYVGLVFPRSSVYKTDLYLSNSCGVIDADYRGSIKAVFNVKKSSQVKHYIPGDRICQLVIVPIPSIEIVQVDDFEEVTERGTGGFGSTDVVAPKEDAVLVEVPEVKNTGFFGRKK